MKYLRLYTDNLGESHFDDVEMDLAPVEYASHAPPLNLSRFIPATQFAFMSAPAGWSADWHPASARSVYLLLSGEWEVTASDGDVRRFSPGSVLIAEDTTGNGHASRVSSDCESLAAVVQLAD